MNKFILKENPVAVIGMSAMFADAKNIENLTNIIHPKTVSKTCRLNRWLIDDTMRI
jgi:acyl transferase domain-containing protein